MFKHFKSSFQQIQVFVHNFFVGNGYTFVFVSSWILLGEEAPWRLVYFKMPAPMVLIMIYDYTYSNIFSNRIPSHAAFNRIWIALRFIHIEIYFSKGKRKQSQRQKILDRYASAYERSKELTKSAPSQTEITYTHPKKAHWINMQENKICLYYGIVCHINGTLQIFALNVLNICTSWFYLIFMFVIFYHICGLSYHVRIHSMRIHICQCEWIHWFMNENRK